jgi:hypothetical protein
MKPLSMPQRGAVSVLVVCVTLGFAPRFARAQAETSPVAPATLKPSVAPSGALNEVVQAGARLLSRGTRGENAKDTPEPEPKGTSTAAAKKAALAAMPLDQLDPEQKQRVQGLLKSASFYRRLPKVTFAVEPDVYGYFIAHPDVAVSIWRAMNISKLQMWQTGRYEYEADAGDGSLGKLDVLYSGVEKHVAVCDGIYKSPLFAKPIEAKSLVLLQTTFFREADGTVYVTHRADLFVSFPSQTVDVVARIFSPLTITMTDRTFCEISLFLKMISLAMSRRPDWVEQIAGKMEGVADVRKEQVRELATQVYTLSQKREIEKMAERSSALPGDDGPTLPTGGVLVPNVPTAGDRPATLR